MFVCFTNEKDLRHYESIRIKASLYTGVAIRVKNVTPSAMDNLLHAIELDSNGGKKIPPVDAKRKNNESPVEDVKGSSAALALNETGIVNLRFEECRISRKAAQSLHDWLRKKTILETIGFAKITFEDIFDFKKIMEGI